MEDVINRQKTNIESLNKIIRNIGKDSASRKTAKYIAQRLETLNNIWELCETTHLKILSFNDENHDYFNSQSYEQAKKSYMLTCVTLQELNTVEAGTPSKSDELISQQHTNFRAFERAVANIEKSKLTEKWEIEDKLQILQNRWKTIDELHWQIDNLLLGTDVDYEEDYANHEDIYEKIKRGLNQLINSNMHQYKSTPTIEIPTFSGNYVQWPTFMDLYTEAIHNNPTLTKALKMQHLKGKLRGEAERIVQHLNISAENYDTCWEILTHRYNNTQILFTKQIQAFMNQPVIHKQSAYEIKRLHDTSLETVNAIHNLGVDTSTWDPILVHILTEKLDPESYTSYMESRKAPRELPSFQELIEFLNNKFMALEPINRKKQPSNNTTKQQQSIPEKEFSGKLISSSGKFKPYKKSYHTSTTARICPICNSDHVLFYCKTYQNMPPETKMNTISKLNICQNCLFCHNGKTCSSKKKCRVCNKSHHTSLHDAVNSGNDPITKNEPKPSTSGQHVPMPRISNHVHGNFEEILLATIELEVQAYDGTYMKMRCLLDQGSQTNLITESAAQRLGLPRRKQSATVSGIGISAKHSNGVIQLSCRSLYGDYTFTTEALIMAKMLNNLPNCTFAKPNWPHLQNITLADPDYHVSRPVDILLDAAVYATIVMEGILRGPIHAPIAQQTKMGWVLMGNVKTFNCHAVLNNIEEISQYWEMEDVSTSNSSLSKEDEYCEELYTLTTTRDASGRYAVRLPMKPNFEEHLGPSKPQAVAQYLQLERKLAKNVELGEAYRKFIHEYRNLGHMKACTEIKKPDCFLPHHGVLKPDSLTTKLRTVFNASFRTKNGLSLNELMECGPKLQLDLLTILLKWRTYKYVYTADIEKFYRQILIQEQDQQLQKILWRENSNDLLTEYQLCTVTYGTKAAPYLALRTIQQLIQDDGHNYPFAVNILNHQLYVDDILGGANTIEEARETQQQLIELLRGGGFNVRKWASNSDQLLDHLSTDLINQNMLDFRHAENNKTLGLSWNPRTDQFTVKQALRASDPHDVITKRTLLSEISKLYDPVGWLAPVTVQAKLMFQRAWMSNIGWDDAVPDNIKHEWENFKKELSDLKNITIPRCVGNTETSIELHGFSDASEKIMACSIYCKTKSEGRTVVKLLAAKTKLAPLKKPVTLPRLELCGALLLSALMKTVIEAIKVQNVTIGIHAWTDSMIVLGWLQGNPTRWKTFVANRVGKILDVIPATAWKHVSSEDNAADCATRGLSPNQLLSHSLWWEGPQWLKDDDTPSQPDAMEHLPEEKKSPHVFSTQTSTPLVETLLQKCSSLTRAVRTLCWIWRFITNARNKDNAQRTLYLTAVEIQRAHNIIVKSAQHSYFGADIAYLKHNSTVRPKSQLLSLTPTVDEEDILRVGGRLGNTKLNESQKHPIILPSHHKLTELAVQQAHKAILHGGAKLTLAYLRHTYWVLGGLRTVKRILRQCVRCHRFKSNHNKQIMADLPAARVTPSRPFSNTGVDFSGQVEVKSNQGRGIKTTKGYIAIFVCMVTKAVHLELVSNLSTSAFLAAFNRLCSRRGKPSHMYSDNGTNFVGAAKAITSEHRLTMKYYNNTAFMDYIAELGIEWHFNAPAWPSAGGLWEAAVRSMKHHLKRVLGAQKLTYEEFSTLLSQIEACLNSRPLVPLTDDLHDVDCLTPGHFLIGSSILAPPSSPESIDRSLTTRWQLVQKMQRDFWRKWSLEYLQTLQSRSKWHCRTKNMETGDLVVVKEENAPPSKWLLGRVTETHPGADGQVRVVTLRTKNGTLKRPVTKLSRLPIEQAENNDTSTNQGNSNDDTPTRAPQQQTRGKRVVNSCIMTLLLCLTCIMPSLQVSVTKLSPTKVMYFDKTADMQIIQDQWKLVVFYNMSAYWASLTTVEHYVEHLNTLSKDEPAYQTIASQFQHELNELSHYNNLLRSEHGLRQKRGLINAAGYLANSLFGVLDERFAEQYHKDIELLQNNEKHTIELYKQHTAIIEGEYNLLKRNEMVMNRQFTIINNQLAALSERIHQNRQNAMYITANALAVDVVISNLRRVQQMLLDLVTDVRNGRVDTHLLTPDQLQHQLNVISGQLPHDLSLPCINSNSCTREMYKLSRVHVRMTDIYLLFEVKLPLISTEVYEMHRVLPIPYIQEGRIRLVVPTAPYLAINLRKDMIIPFTSEDLSLCVHLDSRQLLCNINLPVYDIKTTISVCEAQLINNKQLDSCHTIVSDCADKWVELRGRAGAWLFTCCQERPTRVFCSNAGMTTVTLSGTGIIILDHGCVLKGDHVVVHSHYNFHSEINATEQTAYIPESGVNQLITNNLNISFVPESHEKQLQTLRDKIDSVKVQQESQNSIATSYHEIHHSIMYSSITVLTVIVTIKLGITLRKYIIKLRSDRTCPESSGMTIYTLPQRTTQQSPPQPPKRVAFLPESASAAGGPTVIIKTDAATSPISQPSRIKHNV